MHVLAGQSHALPSKPISSEAGAVWHCKAEPRAAGRRDVFRSIAMQEKRGIERLCAAEPCVPWRGDLLQGRRAMTWKRNGSVGLGRANPSGETAEIDQRRMRDASRRFPGLCVMTKGGAGDADRVVVGRCKASARQRRNRNARQGPVFQGEAGTAGLCWAQPSKAVRSEAQLGYGARS